MAFPTKGDATMAQHAETTSAGAPTDIRPFHYKASDTDLADMKRRIKATRWPEKETVNDDTQGVQLATMQALAKYWAESYDWRKIEARLDCAAAIHHQHRRAGHPLHPRALQARECVADHHHARLAGLDHRANEDHRAVDRSDGARRNGRRRLPCRDSVDARLRILGTAEHDRLGPERTSRRPGTC